MKVIETENRGVKTWRVLMIQAPGDSLGIGWQFGLNLARANNGELMVAILIPDANEDHIVKARLDIAQIHAANPYVNGVHPLIVEDRKGGKDVEALVQETEADLLLVHADGPVKHDQLNHVSCAVAVIRGDGRTSDNGSTTSANNNFQRILVPTSSGPNTAHALRFLLPLANRHEIVALYVANSAQGQNQEALGWSRLREALRFAGASERIQSKVLSQDSIIEGIVEEAAQYDLVLLGASQENRLGRVLFGDIPGAVVRFSQTPVIVVRQPRNRIGHMLGKIAWRFRKIVPNMKLSDRTRAYVRIRRSARPDAQFFTLIALSAMIAALGLIVNSPAVVIGAMLVAPLMSPIVGSGLAIVLGDTRFLRLSLGAVLRGVILAIGVGAISGFLHLDQPLTSELLARTEPTLLDLAIALFSGMAGAYALSNSDAAGALPGVAIAAALVPPLTTVGISLTTGHEREALGALLLFTTNFVAISSATALVFLILGFRPKVSRRERHTARSRSVRVAIILLAIIAGLLTITTYRLAQNSKSETLIRNVIYQNVLTVADARLVSLQIEGDTTDDRAPLQMDLVARSTETIPHETVIELQEQIGIELQREVGLTLTVILVTELDPVVPPTQTPTSTPTNTATPGPTSTPGPSLTPEPSATAAPTVQLESTQTVTPTLTIVETAEPTDQPPAKPEDTETPQPTETMPITPKTTEEPTASATAESTPQLPDVTETPAATETIESTPVDTETPEPNPTDESTPDSLPLPDPSATSASS